MPLDHLILAFLQGPGSRKAIINTSDWIAERIERKYERTVDIDHIDEWPGLAAIPGIVARLRGRVQQLHAESRVYINGHGDFQMQTVGGWMGGLTAKLLSELGMPAVRRVNVLGCQAARARLPEPPGGVNEAFWAQEDGYAPLEVLLGHSLNSYAGTLHYELGKGFNIWTTLTGRLHDLWTRRDGTHYVTMGNDTSLKEREKIVYFWKYGQQVRAWWDFNMGLIMGDGEIPDYY